MALRTQARKPAKGKRTIAEPSRRRDADNEGSDPRIATTLARGLRLLRAFRSDDQGPLSNKDLAERTKLPKATVSRLAYTLVKLGFLAQEPRSGAYMLSAGVLAPAHTYLSRLDIRRVARPYMQQVATQPGVTVSLCARHELRMTTIESVVADGKFPLAGLFGGRAPIVRTAVGHAYLAGLDEEARARVTAELARKYASEWATVESRIRRDIKSIERVGYCVVVGEWTPHINGVAVPIVLADGTVLSLSAGGPSQLLPRNLLEMLGARLREMRSEIEHAVGGAPR